MQDGLALPKEFSGDLMTRDGLSEFAALVLVFFIAIAVGRFAQSHRQSSPSGLQMSDWKIIARESISVMLWNLII